MTVQVCPKPRPGVFRITKNNHNILQGVAPPGMRFTHEERDSVRDWVHLDADRFWFKQAGPAAPEWLEKHASLFPSTPVLHWFQKNGPLVHPKEGGADVIIVDNHSCHSYSPNQKAHAGQAGHLSKSYPDQKRSRRYAGHSTGRGWELLWESIKQADLFISHPVRAFTKTCPRQPLDTCLHQLTGEMLSWRFMVVSSPIIRLDGLNKPMSDWNISYYGRIFNSQCREQYMPTIQFPEGQHI